MTRTDTYARRSRTLAFFLINLAVSFAVCLPFFLKSAGDHSAPFAVNLLMYASSVAVLNLLFLAVLSLLSILRLSDRITAIIAALLATIFHLFLIIDYRIFSVFKFHINGLIINFLTTEGASDSFRLSTGTWITLSLIIAVLCGSELVIAARLYARSGPKLRVRRLLVPSLLLLLVLFDKSVYAYADLTNRIAILQNARYYPYYTTVKIKRIAERFFGYKPEKWDSIDYPEAGRTLQYPLQPVVFAEGGKRYNILFVVLECLRADMVTAEVMPNLTRFAGRSQYFRNHYSGGNATRWGIFTMFYGLSGSLWDQFLAARQSPVLMDALISRNYQFSILSSTKLTFPEFRKTVFVRVQDPIIDEGTEKTYEERDRVLVERFRRFLEARDRARPFMGFIFFNSSHPYFEYPAPFRKFEPVVENPDAIDLTRQFTPEQYIGFKNRYRNSLVYLDSLIEQVVGAVRKAGAFDDTIILIAGDHGSEFNENGYFFYNSAFDDYQLKTPLVMSVPGKPARVVTSMTGHVDIAPTLLNLLGSTTPPEAYSQGRDLFGSGGRSWLLSADWGHMALSTDEYRIIMPGASAFADQRLEVRTGSDYRIVQDKEVLKRHLPAIVKALDQNARFLK